MTIIHLDMDGVLADFAGYWLKVSGRSFEDYATRGEFWREAIKFPNLYQDLKPMKDARHLTDGIREIIKGKDIAVEILTAIPLLETFPLAAEHKATWVKKHFSRKWKFKTGPHAVDKQNHAKPGDILIDDQLRNIDQWNAAGGIGIHHTSAVKTLKELKTIVRDANRYAG